MKKEDLKYYIFLALILLAGGFLFLFFNYNRAAQTMIVLSMAGAYFVWGFIHHWHNKDLHPKIILEYALIAIMASTLAIFLLWRA